MRGVEPWGEFLTAVVTEWFPRLSGRGLFWFFCFCHRDSFSFLRTFWAGLFLTFLLTRLNRCFAFRRPIRILLLVGRAVNVWGGFSTLFKENGSVNFWAELLPRLGVDPRGSVIVRVRILCLSFLMFFLVLSGFARQEGALAAGVVSKELAGDMIEDLDERVNTLLGNAGIIASNVGYDLLNQVRVMIAGILNDADFFAEQRIEQLSDSLQKQIVHLRQVVLELEQNFSSGLAGVTREAAEHLRNTLWEIPLVGQSVVLSRLLGTRIPYGESGTHRIRLEGRNLGFDSSKYKTNLFFKVAHEGHILFPVRGTPYSENGSFIELSMADLLPYRHPTEVVILEADLRIRVVKKRWLKDKKIVLNVPFQVALLPNHAGKVWGQVHSPRNRWVPRPELMESFTMQTPSGHPNGTKHLTSKSFRLPPYSNPPRLGDRKVVKAYRTGCSGPDRSCDYTRDHGCTIIEGGRGATCAFTNWSHGLTLTYKAEIARFEQVEDLVTVLPVQGITYTGLLEIALPEDFYRVALQGEDGQRRRFILFIQRKRGSDLLPQAEISKQAPIRQVNVGRKGDRIVYTFETLQPGEHF